MKYLYKIIILSIILNFFINCSNENDDELICTLADCRSNGLRIIFRNKINESYQVLMNIDGNEILFGSKASFECILISNEPEEWTFGDNSFTYAEKCDGSEFTLNYIAPKTISISISSLTNSWYYNGQINPSYEAFYPNGYECDKKHPCINGEIIFEN